MKIHRRLSKQSNNETTEFRFDIFSTVSQVPSAIWSRLADDKIFLSLNYLSALEESYSPGLKFRYVIIYKQQEAVSILYFQLLDVADKNLGGVINLKEKGWLLKNINDPLNRFIFKCNAGQPNYLICCGSLIVSGEYGIHVNDKEHIDRILILINGIVESIRTSIKDAAFCGFMIKDFFDIARVDQPLVHGGYLNLPMDPEMVFYVRDEWQSFSDYLNSLSSKYRLKANNCIKKISEAEVRILSHRDIEASMDALYELYLQVQQRASVRLVRVSKEYFINLLKYMPDLFYMKGFFLGGKLIAFTSGFHIQGGHHEAHFIGIDYSFNKSHQLYQNILYSFISDAIVMKSKYLYFGRTAIEMKTTVGAKAYPLHTYFRLENNFLNKLAKALVKRIPNENWIHRNPFKE
jgi:hypothetical protein